MKAMVLKKIAKVEESPLELEDWPIPLAGPKQILVKISACGICHTELDEIEGRIQPKLPIILGHEIIGRVADSGSEVTKFEEGERVGIAWINSACGQCYFCQRGMENYATNFRERVAMSMVVMLSIP